MSSRTQRYYRKKAEQAIEGVLESIAPGNASWLYHQVMQRRIRLQAAEGIGIWHMAPELLNWRVERA